MAAKKESTATKDKAVEEEPEVILAPVSDEYEFKGDVPDPGEGLPLEEYAPPAEVPDPPGIEKPYVVTAHVGDNVAKTREFIRGQVWNHLSADDYETFLKELRDSLDDDIADL